MNSFTKFFVLLSCIFVACVVYAEEQENPDRITCRVGNSNDGKRAELVFIRCPGGELTIPGGTPIKLEEFYIMETEMTVEVYQAILEEAKKRGLSLPSIEELNKNFDTKRKEAKEAYVMQTTGDALFEPLRFLDEKDAVNIEDALIVIFGGSKNDGKESGVPNDSDSKEWTKQLEKNEFSIPSFDQWRYAAMVGFDKKQVGTVSTVGDIINYIAQDLNIPKDNPILKDKVRMFLEDQIRGVSNKVFTNFFTEKKNKEYVRVTYKTGKTGKNVNESSKFSLDPYTPFFSFYFPEGEDIQKIKFSDLIEHPFGENIEKTITENSTKPKFNASQEQLKALEDANKLYKLDFTGLKEKIQEELKKSLKWDWKMRIKIGLFVIIQREANFNWEQELKNDNLLEIFSKQNCKKAEKMYHVYEWLVYCTRPSKDNKKIEISKPSDKRNFYNVKDTEHFRPNAIGLYGMFSNTTEYVRIEDKGKTILKLSGISSREIVTKKTSQIVSRLFDLSIDGTKLDDFKKSKTHTTNPVGIRLVLIPNVDSQKFPGLFYHELLIRPNQQEVITEATEFLGRYPKDKNRKNNQEIIEQVKDDSPSNAEFLQLLK